MKKDIDQLLDGLKEYDRNSDSTLSDEEKNRIFQLTMEQIDKSKRKKHKTGRKTAQIVAAVAVVMVLAIGSVAGASIYHLNDKFSRFFRGDDDMKKNEAVEVQNLERTAQEIDQVKLTVDQVIGDDHSVYVMFHLSGISPDVSGIEMKNCNVDIEGATKEYIVSDPQASGYEGDDPYYVIEVRTSGEVADKNISFKVGKIGYYDVEKKKFVVLSKGGYRLNWTLDYEKRTREVEVGKQISVYGGQGTLDRLSISPLSVTVYLKNLQDTKKEIKKANDRLQVVLNDGTIFDSYRTKDGSVLNDFDMISLGLHSIVRYDDIREVRFAGVTVPINPKTEAEVTKLYVNKEMGFTIDMPVQLANVTKEEKTETKMNKSYHCLTDTVSFVGTIKGYSLNLFTISRIHHPYTKKEMDELNPMVRVLETTDQYTYTIQVTEEYPDGEMEAFMNLINDYVCKLDPHINID